MNSILNVVMLGRSGSGKGTQAKLLTDRLNLDYIGTGDLLREFSEQDNTAAQKLKQELAAGKLVPSWLSFFVWMTKLAKTNLNRGVLFDGSPRKLEEAKTLDDVLAWYDRSNVKVILVDISREEAINRLKHRRICSKCHKGAYVRNEEEKFCKYCGGELTIRMEDDPNGMGIQRRLDWFDKEVSQAIEYYKSHNKLIVVNGEQDIVKVHEEIMNKLFS